MFLPEAFEVRDDSTLREFLDDYGFATLVSYENGRPFATHVPLLFEAGSLQGHVSRANPHWRLFDGRRTSLAIFQGPHAYVSPSWYATLPAVPTWNYAAVHVYGVPRVIDDPRRVDEILDRTVGFYESRRDDPWTPSRLPEQFRVKMRAGIVAFEMPVSKIEGKFKLGQNRSREDRDRVVRALRSSGSLNDRALADFTVEHGME